MSDDQIRILGRWKDISTSQYYCSVDQFTLLSIFSKLSLIPESKNESSHAVANFSSFSDLLVVNLLFYQTHTCQSSSNLLSSSNEFKIYV